MRRLLVFLAVAAWAASPARAAGTVGSGTPGSCTEAAFDSALAGGGTVTFSCGGGPVVIPITSTKVLSSSATIDGTGQQVTLDGGGTTKMFLTTYQLATGLHLVFRRLTLRNGRAPNQGAAMELVWQEPGRLTDLLVEDVTFENNVAATSHADWGGGAIYGVTGVFTLRRSAFVGNRGGNGGAIGTIGVRITIEDSRFENNATLPAGSASCPASGSGDIGASVSLPAGGSLAIHASGTVNGLGGARQVTSSVAVAVPAGIDDPVPANNSASLTIPVERATSFYTLGPCRLVDTRNPEGSRGGPALGAAAPRTFPVSGACGVPSTAWAVSLNVAVTQPTAAGNVRLFPGGTPAPRASSLNYAAGATRANNAIAALGSAGDLTALASQAGGTVQLILDVNGYFE